MPDVCTGNSAGLEQLQKETLVKRRAAIDFETHSTVDLRKTGVYVYAEDHTTDMWCAAYQFDNEPDVKLWTPDQECPAELVDHIEDGGELTAWNAAFERTIWSHILGPRYRWPMPKLEQWNCSMARAYAMALPGALEFAAAAIGVEARKDLDGHRLMMRMARPRAIVDGKIIWWDDEPRRLRLYQYCKQDVRTECAIRDRLLELRPSEKKLWQLDQIINDRGIKVDLKLCHAAREVVDEATAELNRQMRNVSNSEIKSVNAVEDIIGFCQRRGVDATSIRRDAVEYLLGRKDLSPDVRRVLEIRAEAGKASVRKIDALIAGCSKDGRARGLLQYHAASTGRWAGRRFQPQNIKRPKNKRQEVLIPAVMTGSAKIVELVAGPPLEIVGDVIRGMVCSETPADLYAADYSNIEGRGLAWLAGEQWKIEAFRAFDQGKGPDIYNKTAGEILDKPPEHITPDERQAYGKVPELALGYQGGVGAFQSMAVNYGVDITDERAEEIKVAWRDKHPRTRQLWYDIEEIAMAAVRFPGKPQPCGKLQFLMSGSFLFMRLPSGRLLCYPYPKIQKIMTPWGEEKSALTFKTAINVFNANKVVPDPNNSAKWARVSTYGGALVENAVQAIARDVLAEAMIRVDEDYPVVMTVHDEIVSEAANGGTQEFENLVNTVPAWATGFPISAKAWRGPRYRK